MKSDKGVVIIKVKSIFDVPHVLLIMFTSVIQLDDYYLVSAPPPVDLYFRPTKINI